MDEPMSVAQSDCRLGRMDGARLNVPLDTKQVSSETFFPASLLARYRENPEPNKTD